MTELGRLLSHGGVVVREYGLQCPVGATGAIHFFLSGDLVCLDSSKGVLARLETE